MACASSCSAEMSWQASTTDSTVAPSAARIGAAAIITVASRCPSRHSMTSARGGWIPRTARLGGSSSIAIGVPSSCVAVPPLPQGCCAVGTPSANPSRICRAVALPRTSAPAPS